MARKIQFKRGAKANLPKLSPAELAFTTDEKRAYIGDGNENIRLLDEKDKIPTFSTLNDLQATYPNGIDKPVWVTSEGCFYYWETESANVVVYMVESATTYGASGSGGWKGTRFDLTADKTLSEIAIAQGGSPGEWELWKIENSSLKTKVANGTFAGATIDNRGYSVSSLNPTLRMLTGSYILMTKYGAAGAKHANAEGSTVLANQSNVRNTAYYLSSSTNPTSGMVVTTQGYAYDTRFTFEK